MALMHLAASLFALYYTYDNSIGWEACRIGAYGRYISPAVMLIQSVLIFYAFLRQSGRLVSTAAAHTAFIVAVLSSNIIVFIIFLRAFLRCTV